MELLTVAVTGYKRFKSKASLQVNGKLVALVGPNEAGKSSLLNAIAHLGHDQPVTNREFSRDTDGNDLRVSGRFFLTDADVGAVGLSERRTFIVTKVASGKRGLSFDPPAPARNVEHRQTLVAQLNDLIVPVLEADDDTQDLASDLSTLASNLEDADETLVPAVLESLQSNLLTFESIKLAIPRATVRKVLERWRSTIELEIAPTPKERDRQALEALRGRVPAFLLFDDQARALESTYSLSQLRTAVPPALASLAEVADLDFPELFSAIDQGLTSKITTIEHRASDTIAGKFKEAWKQSGIKVALRIQGDLLEVQIVEEKSEFTSLAERSDGLRQFVALQMFATRNHADNPVLLIDEADQRLHYDAQADLVQMLARQQVAPKVIYTTHSAGCLPEDLGNGVRTIVPNHQDGSSAIVNRFWHEGTPSLTPLLFGIGASTMAFFPTRRAVMVEGPSDMLLLPTLFREALGRINVEFQFVPGLSSLDKERALAAGAGVAYLMDGDKGGRALEAQLLKLAVSPANIFVLENKGSTALEVEDFIKEDMLIEATNLMIAKWHHGSATIKVLEKKNMTRMQALENAFLEKTTKKLNKVDLAYNLLGLIENDPTRVLLDPKRTPAFKSVAVSIAALLDRK